MVFVVLLLALIIFLLAIPFDVIFNIQRQEILRTDVEVRWLFGAVQLTAPANEERKPTAKSTRKGAKKTKKKSAKFQDIKSLLWNRKFRNRLIKFIKDIFKSFHITNFYCRIRLGLDDPADTGRLWALCGPAAVLLSNLSNAAIDLRPDFHSETVYLDSAGKIRIVPLEVIFTVMAFISSPVTIRALVLMTKSSHE